ncbi:MAG: DUF805 domain-containing protein [Pseudomonadota bacterium]
MSLTDAVRTVLSKYATFQGRAVRSEFWFFVLFVFLLFTVLAFIEGAVLAPALGFSAFDRDAGQPLSLIASLALLLPNIAVAVRRLHDIDRSGWWLLIGFVPVLGFLVLLYWYIQPGTDGANQYG